MSINLMGKDRLFKRLVSGALPCFLLGCSTVPITPGTALAQSDTVEPPTAQTLPAVSPKSKAGQSSMDGQLMFELMIAELAGRRGQLDVAMAGYLRAAKHTDDPRVSERATRLAMYGQQWAEAETACRRWLALEPEATDAREMLAQAFMRQNKIADAIEVYQQLISEADNPELVIRQIQGELQTANNSAQAIEVMQAIVKSVPDNAQAHLTLAGLQLAADDQDDALASIEQALQLDADNSTALLLKSRLLLATKSADDAFSDVEKALEKNPDKLALRLGYAQLLVETGRMEKAGKQLNKLYAVADGNPDTLLTISMLALDARQLDQAQTYLKDLGKTGVYADQANFYLARISDQRKEYETAIEYYEAVGEGELELSALIRIAELKGRAGDLDGGIERLHQLSGVVDDPEVQVQLLTSESRMLQQAGRNAEAVSVLSDALERFPGNGDLLYARALAADVAGDKDRLVSDLNELVESEPDNAHALNALGYHFADNDIELERAETLLVKANELMPNDPAIMDSLGWLRYRQGQFLVAVDLLRAAYTLFEDPEIAAHLGEALWLNGNEEEAKTLIEDALIKSPEDARLLRVKQKYHK